MERPSTGWLVGWVGLSAAGLGVSAYLTRLHLDLFYGSGVGESLCDLGGAFNCSTVNASEYSQVGGIPHALLAIPYYGVMLLLGIRAFRKERGSPEAALMLGGTVTGVFYSLTLAYVSHFLIKAWCLFCISLYVINILQLALSWVASNGSDGAFKALPGIGRAFALSLGVFGLVSAGSWAVYTQQKDVRVAETIKNTIKPTPVDTTAKPTTPPAPNGPIDPTKGQEKEVRLGDKRQEVHIPKDAPSLGPTNAKVQIAVFSDFQCPFCKRLATTLHQLHDEFPKEVRIAYMYFPMNQSCNTSPTLTRTMHPDACAAAVATSCAHKQGKFWEMHDAFFQQQAKLGAPFYKETAADIGLDVAAFSACSEDPTVVNGIKANTDEGGKLGINGTPGMFINGRMMSGAEPIEVLRAVVQAELSGQTGALALKVLVGAEEIGAVTAPATVSVPGMSGVLIDTFEASGENAASKAGDPVKKGLSWYDAKAACEGAGKRLCTEAEWLAACAGQLPNDSDGNGIYSDETIVGQFYGYGGDWHTGTCADSRNPDAPGDIIAGNHPKCVAASGAYDMVGNVKEWVGLSPSDAAVKGGSYTSGESARCGYYRDDLAPQIQDPTIGFRCCSGPTPVAAPEKPGRQVGDTLAPFTVNLLEGGSFDSKKLKGHPAIVTFWASWCGPCRKELPALASLYNKYKDQGLMVLGISVDKTPDPAKAFVTSQGLPFLIGSDSGNTLFDSFDTRGLPTTFWIQKDGKIRLRTVGIPPGAEKRLEELATELMGS